MQKFKKVSDSNPRDKISTSSSQSVLKEYLIKLLEIILEELLGKNLKMKISVILRKKN